MPLQKQQSNQPQGKGKLVYNAHSLRSTFFSDFVIISLYSFLFIFHTIDSGEFPRYPNGKCICSHQYA
jgi:hypothetical protein